MGDSYAYDGTQMHYYNGQPGSSGPSGAAAASSSSSTSAFAGPSQAAMNALAAPSYAQQGPPYQQRQPSSPSFSQPAKLQAMPPSKESQSGPRRQSQSTASHRRDYSINGAGAGAGGAPSASTTAAGGGAVGRTGNPGPYSRPLDQPRPDDGLQQTSVKASSTTSEFTKRKNWSQHIIDELQDFMHVLSPTGDIIFCTPSIQDLTGWSPDDLVGRPITDFIHADDVDGFHRDFGASIRDGSSLNLYYRFRMKDEHYIIFEVGGHPYYSNENGGQATSSAPGAVRECKCFFGMARPYPSKNTAMLDSFLELKMENEKLRQELQVMYKEIEGAGGLQGQYGFDRNRRPTFGSAMGSPDGTSSSVIDPTTGLVQANGLLPSSSNTYGALGIGISATGTKGDGTGDKKKKKPRADDGEFVCRDCGTVDSPEWRKGPDGPKSLCNACGLRYAKLRSKDKLKQQQVDGK